MLDSGGAISHPRPAGFTSLFVYVYEGSGAFGENGPVARKGEVLQLSASGDVTMRADQGGPLGALLLAGEPLGEPVVQHGPFVMSTRAQIMQAFEDYQRGRFLHEECEYRLHTKDGTQVSTRPLDPAYRRGRM